MGYNNFQLYGGQICDYLYIHKTPVSSDDFKYVNAEPTDWGNDTLLFAKFNNNLIAGDSALSGGVSGYEIRRKAGANSYSEYVGTIQSSANGDKNYIVDYTVGNNTEYTYYLYPSTSQSGSGAILSPIITDEVKTDWKYWSLLVVDETEEENVFYLNKLFKFEFNIETDDMSNNASVNVIQNFTEYPTVQYGSPNYWSGSLTSLCGFLSCSQDEYIQTPNMIKELKALTKDTRRKFLKDDDGNIWEVKITSPIVISSDDFIIGNIKTVKFSWTEVGNAEGISIINNPNTPTTSWILTETGEVIPYKEYVWGENYKWNNSYIWTAKDDTLGVEESNIGRNLNRRE